MDSGMAVQFAAGISMVSAVLALGLGACAMPDTDSFRVPDAATLFRPMSVTNYKDRTLPPVAPADLVDANGSCAGAVAMASGETVPMIPAAIALEMSECDVVKRAGIAEKVDIGTNEHRERTATLTYIKGQRPGIYNFTAGRLASMELAPEAPASAKPAKKPAKPTRRAAQPNQVSVQ
jgi:hypothetical protein